MTSKGFLDVGREGAATILTLSRPEKSNAFTLELLDALGDEIEKASADPTLRTLIVTGSGQRSFSAGLDLSVLFEHLSQNPAGEQIRKAQRHLQELFTRLEELEKPTIAAIEGACVGGGLELALACDLRICSAEAKFAFPEAKIGMLPDLGGTTRLARLVGPTIAKEWIFTGRSYSAQRAYELGLVNEICAAGQARRRSLEWAAELERCGPLALAWGKRVIDRSIGMSLRDGLELEQDAMSEILPSDDLKEGVLAFLEKRAAKFRGHGPRG